MQSKYRQAAREKAKHKWGSEDVYTPPPGSDEAVEAGCTCPVMDNRRGAGVFTDREGAAQYWVNEDCPLHTGDDK